MPVNLRERLRLIQGQKMAAGNTGKTRAGKASLNISIFLDKGWVSCGCLTLKREVLSSASLNIPASLPSALPILIPDLMILPSPEDFLFFDLETTGLSGGAGTVAFLAAFGRLVSSGKLHITQYLLLDYPGEDDFLDAVLEEFKEEKSVIVSYNGKCFDSPILATRCFMNGKRPPEYSHADLLYPARRLWKTVIGDCSQQSVETRILGLDRSDDTPGALAPEIWFDFLRTGNAGHLFGVCDHNAADISGLASMLAAMIRIAADPFAGEYLYDQGRVALRWRDYARFDRYQQSEEELAELREKGKRLLRIAAEESPRASFAYAQDLLKSGCCEEGRIRLRRLAESFFPDNIKAAALRLLAIDSERRLKACEEAYELAKLGLELNSTDTVWRVEFERRAERLEKKLQALNRSNL
jgi:uncharacterized protein YprB with RNaseH-like and TPR domain